MTAVSVLFAVPNYRDVLAAINSVQASLEKLSKAGISSYDRQKQGAEKSFKETAKSADRLAKEAARAQEREAKAAAKAIERSAKEASKAQEKIDRDLIKAFDKSQKEKTKAVEREAKEQLRIRNATNAVAMREWKKEIRDQTAEHARGLRERESTARTFGRTVGGAVGRAVGMVGRVAGIAATLGGGFTIADSLGKGIREEATAGTIFRGAQNKGGFANQKEVLELASNTAIATGGTTEDILGGLDQFVRKTGDLGSARKILEDMAKLSAATGTNFADMGNTAAEIQNQLGDTAQTMEVMRALAGQGKAGAIDIKDLGQYGGRLAASAAQFQGDLSGNIESFGAIAQLAKKLGGATDTAEATESVARLSSDFAKHEYGFKQLGVNVFADKNKTKFRNAEDVITEAVVKSKGDQTVLKELFGERSIKAALGAQVAYANAGGGAAGESAIREQFASLRATTMTKGDVDEGLKSRLAENDAKINQAMEELHRTVNNRLLPMLPGLIEKFTELIPTIGKFMDFLISNPWTGIGMLVGGAIVKDIAAAGLGRLVAGAVTGVASKAMAAATGATAATSAVTGGAAAVEGAALGASGSGAAAAGGSVLAGVGGLLGAGVGALYGISYIGQKRGEGRVAALMGADESTPEAQQQKLASLQGLLGRVGAQEAAAKKLRSGASTDSITPAEAKALGDTEAAAAAKNLDKLTAAIEKLNQQMDQATEKMREVAGIDVSMPAGPADPNHPSRGALAP